jgi:hypothetical protein
VLESFLFPHFLYTCNCSFFGLLDVTVSNSILSLLLYACLLRNVRQDITLESILFLHSQLLFFFIIIEICVAVAEFILT